MSDSSRNKAAAQSKRGPGASGGLPSRDEGSGFSIVRTGLASAFAVAGIAWITVYINVGQDIAQGIARDAQPTWMSDLERWNFLIGFVLVFIGLAVAAHPSTPLGRGRGVVVGMLGCFLLGLIWIVVYYIAGATAPIPVVRSLDQYNLVVGIGFMAVGFVYATRWE